MSLLPIIRIVEFLEEPLTGGTTKPMLVLGDDGKKYVLKIFSIKNAIQRPYTVAEVIAHLLAKEFDLSVPTGVYLSIDPALVGSLKMNNSPIYQLLLNKDTSKILFGTEYLEGSPIFSSSSFISLEMVELESIFAFDLLIANEDRRINKPNMLRNKKHCVLIDHDKAFEGLTVIYENYQKGILPYFYRTHLFFETLHNKSKKGNSVTFETFEEYLRSLNLTRITKNTEFLIEAGYDKQTCLDWLDYIQKQKDNYRKFVTLLKQKISE